MFGCAGSGKGEEDAPAAAGLQVGFGKENFSPSDPVPLQGGDWKNRISTGMLDYLFVTCIAITNGDDTVLIYTIDQKVTTDNFADVAKAEISSATGVPQENILINATHTHAATALRYNWEGVEAQRKKFSDAAVKAAQTALSDRSAAEIYAGGVQTQDLTFVRHYVLADGTPTNDRTNPGITDHYREADQELQIVKFARSAENKKDIVLLSFPSHATINEGGLEISADYPAPTRDYVEAKTGALVAFFQGASGNQAPDSLIPGKSPYGEDYRKYGEVLGEYAVSALPTLKKVEGDSVKLTTKTFTGPTNKKNMDKLVGAQEVGLLREQYGNNAPEVQAAMEKYGFVTYLEASWTVIRSKTEDTMSMDLRTLAVGDLSFVFAPYEMFGHHGTDIKKQSPYENTFIVTCSEGSLNYIASTDAFDFNSYESYCCYFAQGTGEKLVEEFVSMLTATKQAQ